MIVRIPVLNDFKQEKEDPSTTEICFAEKKKQKRCGVKKKPK
jgi:hypothetical protein